MSRQYLNVPRAQKYAAKSLGTRIDGAVKRWHVDEGRDLAVFAQWLPVSVQSPFRADAVHGKTWGAKGQTPIVERPGQRQSISAASAVNSKGGFWFKTYQGALTGELFVELLQEMMREQDRPIHLVVDGLPAHKKAIVKQYVQSTGATHHDALSARVCSRPQS